MQNNILGILFLLAVSTAKEISGAGHPPVELILCGDTVVKHFLQGSIKWAQQKLHTCWLQELAVLMEAQ